MKKSLFDDAAGIAGVEAFETLLTAPGIRLERILSRGAGPTEWYDQGWSEWACVVRGEALLEWGDGSLEELSSGDCLWIEPHCRHRVVSTSVDCVWLALHVRSSEDERMG